MLSRGGAAGASRKGRRATRGSHASHPASGRRPSCATLDIKFDRDEKAALWDLRIEDKDGNHIEWEQLDLPKTSKVTLHHKDGKGTAEVE